MTTKKNLVKQMFMSILTAAIFSFSFVFTACSDDEFVNNPEEGSDKIGNYANYEPYGLTYHNFDGADDVRILNADTTEIAVKKSLADKLGITNFENEVNPESFLSNFRGSLHFDTPSFYRYTSQYP